MGLLNPNIPDQPQDNAQPNVAPDATVTPQAGGTTAPNLPPQTPTAPPNAQPTQPTPQLSPAQQQAQSQQAMSLHGKIFQNVLSTLAGGSQRPVRDQQGNPVTDSNGNVQMAPASKKVLAGSILAGAISGLLASMSQPRQFTQLPGGRMIEDTSRAIAAGAKAGQQFSAQGQKDIAQQQANDIQTRQYATIDHNLKLHMALMSNLKMQGDLLDAGTDEDSPLIEGLKTAPPIPDPKDPTKTIEPIQAQGVTEQQLLPLMKDGSVTRQSILRDGKVPVTDSNGKPVMNPDGTPR